eukprot:15463617-Alexandrium_andersonii.AAC.1
MGYLRYLYRESTASRDPYVNELKSFLTKGRDKSKPGSLTYKTFLEQVASEDVGAEVLSFYSEDRDALFALWCACQGAWEKVRAELLQEDAPEAEVIWVNVGCGFDACLCSAQSVSYTHLRAHETSAHL